MTIERHLLCDGKKRRVDWGTGENSKPAVGVRSVKYNTETGLGQIVVDIALARPIALRMDAHVIPFTRSMTIHEDDKNPQQFVIEWLEHRRKGSMMEHDVRITAHAVLDLPAGND